MDRRLFLTGVLGVAGAATIALARPTPAQALVSGRGGILDSIDDPAVDDLADGEAEAQVEQVYHRPRHRRRRVWVRECRRVRRHGRVRTRCRRRRIWRWVWI